MELFDVIVIGGGAAGFFGAIRCAEQPARPKVLILEKSRETLTKVKISGGGRCNATHACFDPPVLVENYPRGGKALYGPLMRFQPRDAVEWFAGRGVSLKTEPDGRMFPVTDDSRTVVDCLRNEARKAGVEVRTGMNIASLERGPRGFAVRLTGGETLSAKRVLLATGSNRQAWGWAAGLGHTLQTPVPSLFTFVVSDERLQGLAGISVEDAGLSVEGTLLKQRGPLLITHWGLSGPAVLKLSAWGARLLHEKSYQFTLRINWKPALDPEGLRRLLAHRKSASPRQAAATSGSFLPLPRRLWERLAAGAGMQADRRWAEISSRDLETLARELEAGAFSVTGKSAFKEEFVTCGGVALDEVDFKTMESRKCPGLFFAGEVLDIDGVTGGFNFQAAWTTGWIAGGAMAP